MAIDRGNADLVDRESSNMPMGDISNEVFKKSVLFATKNGARASTTPAQPTKMSLPKVQGSQVSRKSAQRPYGSSPSDEFEYLWMPSMRVYENGFKSRMEKYSHMEFTRNYNNYRLYTPRGAMSVFLSLGMLLLGLGIALMFSSWSSFTLEIPYSEENNDPIKFTIDKDIKAPVYFYYKLSDFYATHKKVTYDSAPASITQVYSSFEEILNLRCIDGKNTLNGVDSWCTSKNTIPEFKLPAYPCGAISATIITDNFMICQSSLEYTLENVKSDGDKAKRCLPLTMMMEEADYGLFHSTITKSVSESTFYWLDLSNNMFRSWIQLPYDSTFLKPYAVLNQDLRAGNYTLFLTNNYWPSKAWNAQKAFYIAKPGFLGTPAKVLEVMVMVTAAIYLLSGIVVAGLYMMNYSCQKSPWRGIKVHGAKHVNSASHHSKHLLDDEPEPFKDVPKPRLPCLCPCH
ncbi:hypothetical protein X943_000670 [Babesia divergens]|uniref:LEM3/CDC50 family protein n=1 Tax=Babesia divergens TaxID=32595 RepID=A0AAD9GL32_BABDI|nr:hypothetical protein X943_000670 [Babesia divergens]